MIMRGIFRSSRSASAGGCALNPLRGIDDDATVSTAGKARDGVAEEIGEAGRVDQVDVVSFS
jgi:hypothetical protein